MIGRGARRGRAAAYATVEALGLTGASRAGHRMAQVFRGGYIAVAFWMAVSIANGDGAGLAQSVRELVAALGVEILVSTAVGEVVLAVAGAAVLLPLHLAILTTGGLATHDPAVVSTMLTATFLLAWLATTKVAIVVALSVTTLAAAHERAACIAARLGKWRARLTAPVEGRQ